jgi:hypothetical protein
MSEAARLEEALGNGRLKHQAPHTLGMAQRELQGRRSAARGAYDADLIQAEQVQQAGHRVSRLFWGGSGSQRRAQIAGAGRG